MPSSYPPNVGGVEEHVSRVARGLQGRGRDVLVIVNQWPRTLSAREVIDGIDVRRLDFSAPGRHPRRLARHLRTVRVIQSELDQLDAPDLVHLHCLASQTGHLVRWSRRRRVPLVLTTHGETAMDPGQTYQRNAFQRAALRTAARHAVALTACSAWARADASRFASRFREARVVHNGVDVGELAGLPVPTDPVFVAYGRQVPEKGFDLLVAAMPEVRRRLPGARLLLAGDGPQAASLRASLAPEDEHLGRLDRRGVRRLLASARTVVVPSRVEPFGIVAREALAAGRQLVYARTGGLPEAAGGFGIGVAPGSSSALVEGMVAAHAGRGRLPASDVLAAWEWDRVVDVYDDLYERLL